MPRRGRRKNTLTPEEKMAQANQQAAAENEQDRLSKLSPEELDAEQKAAAEKLAKEEAEALEQKQKKSSEAAAAEGVPEEFRNTNLKKVEFTITTKKSYHSDSYYNRLENNDVVYYPELEAEGVIRDFPKNFKFSKKAVTKNLKNVSVITKEVV